MAEQSTRSWFAVFNNPSDHGYEGSPQEVCERLRDEWITGSDTRSGAWAYCISADGLHHVHMVLEDTKTMRFGTIKKTYAKGMHFVPTKGTKKQADDYINKRGIFEEKGESVEFICYHGEIQGRQGSRSDIRNMYDRLKSGETPSDILSDTPSAYLRREVLQQMYFDIRSQNTPIVRPMQVYWHTGKSGSGKSYSRIKLANDVGEDNIYYLTAFNSGAFDNYNGQKYLWIEDYRGEFKLQELLRMLDVYKAEIPARFHNVKALWEEVHITSVLMPREIYSKASLDENDRIEQLLRRITSIIYHVKSGSDYLQFGFDSRSLRSFIESEVSSFVRMRSDYVPCTSYGDLSDFVDILSPDDLNSYYEVHGDET